MHTLMRIPVVKWSINSMDTVNARNYLNINECLALPVFSAKQGKAFRLRGLGNSFLSNSQSYPQIL